MKEEGGSEEIGGGMRPSTPPAAFLISRAHALTAMLQQPQYMLREQKPPQVIAYRPLTLRKTTTRTRPATSIGPAVHPSSPHAARSRTTNAPIVYAPIMSSPSTHRSHRPSVIPACCTLANDEHADRVRADHELTEYNHGRAPVACRSRPSTPHEPVMLPDAQPAAAVHSSSPHTALNSRPHQTQNPRVRARNYAASESYISLRNISLSL
ncbi:hypothetical protein FIBSPDRAFT_888282 [Athelia psychrophila]|uniref:Uncharacterized protein n=1 Tax=Athelia psychrophila TaxID=1759441 RepID=A0A166NL66_9AGAM|nr:hypothetical protein FIBSPDRAFT_888282 [Fibularhizoctonia sp. CBS 109695]